jgi:hypothetical protein
MQIVSNLAALAKVAHNSIAAVACNANLIANGRILVTWTIADMSIGPVSGTLDVEQFAGTLDVETFGGTLDVEADSATIDIKQYEGTLTL